MSNDGTRQNNDWDDELDSQPGTNNTGEPRPRRRRLPSEQPPRSPQPPLRRPRPTTESRQSSTPRPRTTSDLGQSQGSSRPRSYRDATDTTGTQQGRPRLNANVPQRQRPLPETDIPQSPRPRSNTSSQSRQTQQTQQTQQTRPRPRSTTSGQGERRPPRRQPPLRQRRIWPWLLVGCFGGILLIVLGVGIAAYLAIRSATGGGIGIGGIGNASSYTQHNQQVVSLSVITQLQIHNQIGNVSITVDPNATAPLVSTTKIVKANSQSDANSQFNSIAVQVEPTGTPSGTLAVNASVSNNGSLFGNHNDSVDMVITLPPGVNTGTTPVVLNAGSSPSNITSVGNVTISGLNGVLNVKDDIGTITVQNALLSPGSTLETGTGNIIFNGSVDTTSGSSSNQSIYTMQSEAGNLDVTLPATINVTLDVYTNSGKITSDFDLSRIKQPDGSISGPILPGTMPNALLKLHVSTGNIALHKA